MTLSGFNKKMLITCHSGIEKTQLTEACLEKNASLILFRSCLLRFFGDVTAWVVFRHVVSGFCRDVLINELSRKTTGYLRSSGWWRVIRPPCRFVRGYLRGEEWKAWRSAESEERAVTLKNPLFICHCQEFSAKVDSSGTLSNTNKQMKRSMMKEHFSHSAEDMTYVASCPVSTSFERKQRWIRFQQFPVSQLVKNTYQQLHTNGKLASNGAIQTLSGCVCNLTGLNVWT